MARPKTSGLRVSKYKRPDGTVLEYFYDRESGNFLGHDRAQALARMQLPNDRNPVVDPNTFGWLINLYLARPEFKMELAPKTQNLYRGYLKMMARNWGDMPYRAFDAGAVEEIKAAFRETPRKANQVIGLFRILLGYAVRLRKISHNPALRPKMLPSPPRTEVWSYAEEAAFLKAARPSLRLALMLMLYTAQRPSDVLAMTRNNIFERNNTLWLLLRQQKTDALVEIPLHPNLEPVVRERLADQSGVLLLVPSPTGKPWAYRNFSRAWDATMQTAGLKGMQRRDTRRTAVVRMAEAGATVPLIASVTGWEIEYCQRIVDTYLPRRSELAAAAIDLWARGGQLESRVVSLDLHRRKR